MQSDFGQHYIRFYSWSGWLTDWLTAINHLFRQKFYILRYWFTSCMNCSFSNSMQAKAIELIAPNQFHIFFSWNLLSIFDVVWVAYCGTNNGHVNNVQIYLFGNIWTLKYNNFLNFVIGQDVNGMVVSQSSAIINAINNNRWASCNPKK